jgi:putative ABC transport system permease protein
MMLRYTIRSLIARRRSILPTILGIAATVATVVVILAMLEGFLRVLDQTGSTQNAIVLSRGAPSEDLSNVSLLALNQIKAAKGIGMDSDALLVSPEVVAVVGVKQPDGEVELVTMRGVDSIALRVHAGVFLAQGTLPESGTQKVLIGQRQLGRLKDAAEGGTMELLRQRWVVSGVLSSPGSRFESEIWCDRVALMTALRKKTLSSVTVSLASPAEQAGFAKSNEAIHPEQLETLPERDYYQRSSAPFLVYMDAIKFVILLMLIGAIFSCTNAMYGTFLERTREFSTLRAIGFNRFKVARIVAQESILLALCGGLIGLSAAFGVHGRSMSMTELQLVYTAFVSPRTLVAAIAASAIIGAVGAVVAVAQAVRSKVLIGLR